MTIDDRMPIPCTGGIQFGNRYFRCWEKKGHGSLDLRQAIAKSCDVYFYQLGLRLGLDAARSPAACSSACPAKAGIDLPDEKPSALAGEPSSTSTSSTARRLEPTAVVLNLAIGQGDNSQTVLNMARFYTALATDGAPPSREIVRATAGADEDLRR